MCVIQWTVDSKSSTECAYIAVYTAELKRQQNSVVLYDVAKKDHMCASHNEINQHTGQSVADLLAWGGGVQQEDFQLIQQACYMDKSWVGSEIQHHLQRLIPAGTHMPR